MKALPTRFKGINYRSLLEARYAAWFDLVGVPVQYEPEAFAGYIPDFMHFGYPGDRDREFGLLDAYDGAGAYCRGIVFEVKGALESFDFAKIRQSGWRGAVVCLDARGPAHAYIPDSELHECNDGGGAAWSSWREAASCYFHVSDLESTWAEAGNLIQWKPHGPRKALANYPGPWTRVEAPSSPYEWRFVAPGRAEYRRRRA